jgi:hypothetical protein
MTLAVAKLAGLTPDPDSLPEALKRMIAGENLPKL